MHAWHPFSTASAITNEMRLGITDYLAIYGAGLSTVVAVWNYVRSQSQIRIQLVFAAEGDNTKIEHGFGISVQNPSEQTVHINHVSLVYPYRSIPFRERIGDAFKYRRLPQRSGWCHTALSNYGVEDRCPVSIEAGKSHYIFVRHEVIEQVLAQATSRSIKAVVQDALWRNTYSKAFEYSVPKVTRTSDSLTIG
jgi:hypothetical protein